MVRICMDMHENSVPTKAPATSLCPQHFSLIQNTHFSSLKQHKTQHRTLTSHFFISLTLPFFTLYKASVCFNQRGQRITSQKLSLSLSLTHEALFSLFKFQASLPPLSSKISSISKQASSHLSLYSSSLNIQASLKLIAFFETKHHPFCFKVDAPSFFLNYSLAFFI